MKYEEIFCSYGYDIYYGYNVQVFLIDKFPSRAIMLFLRTSHIRFSCTIILSRKSRAVGKYAVVLASIIVSSEKHRKGLFLNQHLL